MTINELNTVLDGIGIPFAYQAFPATEAPEMPFIVYMELGSDNFGADNIVWHSARRIEVDLLCKTRNLTLESQIETALNDTGIYWERELDHNDDEACFVTTYIFEIGG